MLNIPQITETLQREGQYFKNSTQEMTDRVVPCHVPARGHSLHRHCLPSSYLRRNRRAKPGCLQIGYTPLLKEKRWKR